MLWGNTAYCVNSSGEGLLRYSNKIESAGLRKCLYYRYLTNKVMSHCDVQLFSRHDVSGKTAGIDIMYQEITSLSPYVYTRRNKVKSGWGLPYQSSLLRVILMFFSVSNSDYYFNFPEKACIQTPRDAAAFGDRMSVTETYKHATHQQILHRSVVICISQ